MAEYEMAKKVAKKAVTQVQQQERKRVYEKFNMDEGLRSVIAKQLAKEWQSVSGVNSSRDESKARDGQEEMKGVYGVRTECRECIGWNGKR